MLGYLLVGFALLTTIGGTVEEARIAYYRGQLAGIQERTSEVLQASYENGRAYQVAEDAASLDVGKKLVEYRNRLQTKTVTLTKEVPVYVPASAVLACTVPIGFVLLHDNAASRSTTTTTLPESFAGIAGADSGFKLDHVASIIETNYGKCNEAFATLDGWKDWYTKAKAIYDAWAAKAARN